MRTHGGTAGALLITLCVACSSPEPEPEPAPAPAPSRESAPAPSPAPAAERAPLLPKDLERRACALLRPEDVARVAGLEPAALEPSELQRDHGVVHECAFSWGDPVRNVARVFDVEVASSIPKARQAAVEEMRAPSPRAELRALAGVGDEAYLNAAIWRRHTKDPDGETQTHANTIWLRVGNLRLKLSYRDGRFDRSFERELITLAKDVASRARALQSTARSAP